jgi:sulfite reductase (NADPH) hemoprotein beta-component
MTNESRSGLPALESISAASEQPIPLCREELNKLNSSGMRGSLHDEVRDHSRADIAWEAEQIAKSYGIYLEFDRSKTGQERDWIYMIRVTIPGGGPITKDAWQLFDELSDRYATPISNGGPSLRLTTRQNVQFHWIKKEDLLEVVRRIAESGFSSLNGCGDNTRNVMACPISRFSDVFDANKWAHKVSSFFELPAAPFIQIFQVDPHYVRSDEEEKKFQYGEGLLNRKFKIAFATVHRHPDTGAIVPDNCVESRTNDVAIAPVFENQLLQGFQIHIGGGQGQKNGKPTMAALGKPFAFVLELELMQTLDAIVKVHQEWGERNNRNSARLKYVIKKSGIDWFRDRVQEIVDFRLQEARPDHDCGPRQLHHGWCRQPTNDLWTFGAFIENGRIVDSPANGRLKTAIKEILDRYPIELTVTPNQDILFSNIPSAEKEKFIQDLESYGFGQRNGGTYSLLRKQSGACVGRITCRLAYTDSETFEPILIDDLEKLGWGHINTSIGVTGCERQCYRPATKAIGLVGSGLNLYQLKLLGTEDGRHQGEPIVADDGTVYLGYIPREQVVPVIDALFRFYINNREGDEELGYYHRRIGLAGIIENLKSCPETAWLMANNRPINKLEAAPT